MFCISAVAGSKQVFLTIHMHHSQALDYPKHTHPFNAYSVSLCVVILIMSYSKSEQR